MKQSNKLPKHPHKKSEELRCSLLSAEVRQIRKNLNLTQKEAARICGGGGGPNAFSRYERGEAVPSRATCNLLRLLIKYPTEIGYLLSLCL